MTRLGENHPTFRTQYALLPLEAGDGLFTDTHLMAMSGEYPRLRLPRPGDNYVGGLDLGGDAGAGADSTVLTVAAVTPEPGSEPRLRVVNHFAWTGLPGGALIPRVLEVVRAWKLRRLAVDATGLGQPLAGMLRRSLGSRIVSFVFTRKTKSELGYQLLASVGTGRLELYARDASPESVECWRQLETAEAEYRADRTMNFFVNPATGHDDYLISLALALKAAECYRPRTASGVR
jgi:phage FluMu gp28-like protein